MKKCLIFMALVTVAAPAFSQQNANERAIAHQKTLAHFGSFTHNISDNRYVSISYSFMPLEPATSVTYSLHASTSGLLSFKIADATGKIVAEWQPADTKYLHKGTLDVSGLKPGKYEYRIFWDGKLTESVPFTKK